MEKKKFNTNAIYSCIFSIVSLFIFWWLAPVGLGLGIRALNGIKTKQEKGKALAIIGIIVGTIGLGLYFYGKIISM